MADPVIHILKASGQRVPFSEEKLGRSLQRSGAGQTAIRDVIEAVRKQLYEGIPSRKIYRMAFAMLKGHSRPVAAKYKLKQAIMELGPSGYPFEKYIGEILRHNGFSVQVDVIVKGHCVNHEIDVIAEKENKRFMIECKYHNSTGIICDVKIPLYIQARFQDVEKGPGNPPSGTPQFHQGWVVTNTKFSEDAIQYGTCIGLRLMGWNYPEHRSLRDEIDNSGLYPLTCLISLSRTEKQRLIDNKIVLCREICDNNKLLLDAGISPGRLDAVLKEASALCKAKALA